MSINIFISFRFADGKGYKEQLVNLFDKNNDTIDYSEDEDRSTMSEATIKSYLYRKLRRSSVTVILLTPGAVNHKINHFGKYDDWMYDEIRYSLEDRENNRTNGLIAVYTPEAENMLLKRKPDSLEIYHVDNLFRRNMMNILPSYKHNLQPGKYDRDWDSYCSLIPYYDFKINPSNYIEIALKKRALKDQYIIEKR